MPTGSVSAAFGLEGDPRLYKVSSEPMEHTLDDRVGANAKDLVSDFSRQMPIPEMPRKAHKLPGVFMPDFDNRLRNGTNLQPPPIFKLHAVSIGHRNRFREVEKDIFALVCSQANAAAMAPLKIESESARRLFPRPMLGWAMN